MKCYQISKLRNGSLKTSILYHIVTLPCLRSWDSSLTPFYVNCWLHSAIFTTKIYYLTKNDRVIDSSNETLRFIQSWEFQGIDELEILFLLFLTVFWASKLKTNPKCVCRISVSPFYAKKLNNLILGRTKSLKWLYTPTCQHHNNALSFILTSFVCSGVHL